MVPAAAAAAAPVVDADPAAVVEVAVVVAAAVEGRELRGRAPTPVPLSRDCRSKTMVPAVSL